MSGMFFENHHIALIAKEQFYAVQKNKRKVIKPAKKSDSEYAERRKSSAAVVEAVSIFTQRNTQRFICVRIEKDMERIVVTACL